MNQHTALEGYYGELTEPDTLVIQRRLPGPIERVWDYLTDGELRRRWLAAGEMTLEVGAPFEFVWRNDELTDPAGRRPDGSSGEHRLKSRITEVDPPRRLAFEWDETGGVSFDLEAQDDKVLLTVTHRRVPRRSLLVGVSTGWHVHLDVLAARLEDTEPEPFWDSFARLKTAYESRIPA